MALRAVMEHPKFAELQALLSLPKYAVLGCLEAVWHFTGRFSPQGNIGKYTDQTIESWVGWTGEQGNLVKALITSKWIDESSEFRLVVHDWHIHADSATRLALKRSKKNFCIQLVHTQSIHTSYNDVTESALGIDGVAKVSTPSALPGAGAGAGAGAKAKASPKAVPSEFVLPAWMDAQLWNDFEEMRRKIKKPMTDRARRNILAKLIRFEALGMKHEEVLNNSITNDWQDVYEIKSSGGKDGFGNRGQQRTDGNIEAARRAAANITARHGDGAGGSTPGSCELPNSGTIRGMPF
jgi:hypothetical protein